MLIAYLLMILDAHTKRVDQNRHENPTRKVVAYDELFDLQSKPSPTVPFCFLNCDGFNSALIFINLFPIIDPTLLSSADRDFFIPDLIFCLFSWSDSSECSDSEPDSSVVVSGMVFLDLCSKLVQQNPQ